LSDEIIKMRRNGQQQCGFFLRSKGFSARTRRNQSVMDRRIDLLQFFQKDLIQTKQTIAMVKIVEGKAELQGRNMIHGISV